MTKPLQDGMTLLSSNWGNPRNDMKWLDGETGCAGTCGGLPGGFSVSNL